jgi:transcriptional regulator with XRE-family HTH domain
MNDTFGERLRAKVRAKHWNQSDLARASGLGRDSISTYINGSTKPSPKNLAKIAQVIGCRVAELMPDWDVSPPEETILELTQHSEGRVKLRVAKTVTLDQAVAIFDILKN